MCFKRTAERGGQAPGKTARYIGALIRLGSIGTPDAIIQVLGESPRREFQIGTSGATNTKWSLYASDSVGSAVTQVTTANVTTDTTLLLTRIDYTVSGDRVRLYVNPLEASEPSMSDADISTEDLGSSLATTEFFRVFFFGGNRGFIDEIRVADSFQEATSFSSSTSTPEPSSLLLMGIAVALASCWRIRRRHVAAKV
ncbi:MAG: PEP-CTERM sorting domain-containing protein [Planctomycetia bacterium]|nr:PEP-CTERM sorting domain-containing protein [Planctomycetia bacterium]